MMYPDVVEVYLKYVFTVLLTVNVCDMSPWRETMEIGEAVTEGFMEGVTLAVASGFGYHIKLYEARAALVLIFT